MDNSVLRGDLSHLGHESREVWMNYPQIQFAMNELLCYSVVTPKQIKLFIWEMYEFSVKN